MIPEIHLEKESLTDVTQETTRRFPLNGKNLPFSDGTPEGIHKVIEFLQVDKSRRYRDSGVQKFPHVYLHDFAFLCGAYAPRVWWTNEAIKYGNFIARMGGTISEIDCNSLCSWFVDHGNSFGWSEVSSITNAQDLANSGKCVVMVLPGKGKTAKGHVCAIVPESDAVKNVGSAGVGVVYISVCPVMSQAGGTGHFKYFAKKWWEGAKPLIFVHNKQPD